MKIDLHCHTQKVKTGDAVTRNVTPEKFATKITEADVKIVAITNHNKFDYKQYLQLKESVKDICNVWPGVELDIQGKSDEDGKVKRGHLIVIANPDNAEIFAKKMEELIQDQSPDEFLTDVVTVFDKLDECDTIYIPHFHKEPHLSEKDIEELNAHLKDRSRLFKETSDYRSLGVFSNFDYSVIIGSDVQNWDNYEKSKFADIRLPIDTFQQFCLLAKKDKQIIDTLLNKKRKKNITVSPHKSTCFEIPIYEDINIIFGQKGTGKSEIINSLKTYYEKNSVSYRCYVGNAKENDFQKLLKTDELTPDPKKLGLDDMKQEFLDLYIWLDEIPTSLSTYEEWWKTRDNNKNKKRMKITEAVKIEAEEPNRKLDNDYKHLQQFVDSSFDKIDLSNYLSHEEVRELRSLLEKLCEEVSNSKMEKWRKERAVKLTNWSIEHIKKIADKCSDTISKPGTTGFYEFAKRRFELYELINSIEEAFEVQEYVERQFFGNLEEKGDIFIQNRYRMLCKVSKTDEFRRGIKVLRECKDTLDDILNTVFTESLTENVVKFHEVYESGIKDISEFIGISRETVLEDSTLYQPSNGERGILLLQRLLCSDSDVYLLDEPELGMGNSYITSAILPKLISLAKGRKTVIIATHNANLAVGTLPYVSIFRTHKNGEYKTYVGNPFCDELINIEDSGDIKNWTMESMHTLEGGRDAFYERRDIYESGRKTN